jgi:hypothetical protein
MAKSKPVKGTQKQKQEAVEGECVYCGQIRELDRDHVPPENLFPKPRPSNLVTVPSCRVCNKRFSSDDEYFRTALSLTLDPSQDPRLQQIVDKALRSFKRPESAGLTRTFLRTFNKVELRGPSGLYYGKATTYTVDLVRVRRTCNRIVRGLYFKEMGHRLPSDAFTHTEVVRPITDPKILDENFENIQVVANRPAKAIGTELFFYKYVIAEDEPLASIWLLNFYHKILVLGLSVPNRPPPTGD